MLCIFLITKNRTLSCLSGVYDVRVNYRILFFATFLKQCC